MRHNKTNDAKKIVVACDSFKGSLSSREACEAARKGILRAFPEAEVKVVPVADGGEGTVEALVDILDCQMVPVMVRSPLGNPAEAWYGLSDNGATAIMEMARASGITLDHGSPNPLRANTCGTGEMIIDALSRGCRTVIMGIGGSATNDAGMGLLSVLGVKFLDSDGCVLFPCGGNLERISSIDLSGMNPLAKEAKFLIACDVDNPLYGPQGAAYVFAPQKGADPDTVESLDRGLRVYAAAVEKATGRNVSRLPGAGAAGGLGACFAAFFNSSLERGSELMLKAVNFRHIIEGADLIITGEGQLDPQTLMGKIPFGVLEAAKERDIPVIALGGAVTDTDMLLCAGFTAAFPVVPGPASLENAMKPEFAAANVARTARMVVRTFFHQVSAS